MKLKRKKKSPLAVKAQCCCYSKFKNKNIANFILTLPNWLKCIKHKAYINL